MVEQPYYQAEMDSGVDVGHTPLKDAINEYGVRERERATAKYGETATDAHTEVVVDSWAGGPLLRLKRFDTSGNVVPPTLGTGLCQVIVQAGYVPWGFRPEKKPSDTGGRERTGRWMWYLRPVGDITDADSEVYDSVYAIKTPEGEHEYLRNDQGDLVTFGSEANAEAVADQVADDEVVEVPN
jgi:hypothetical protein